MAGTRITQGRHGLSGRRYGSFAGKGIRPSSGAVVAGEIFVAGVVKGQTFRAGSKIGQTFVAGEVAGEVEV